jgi:hypothetical protein
MNRDAFARLQHAQAAPALHCLAMSCRRRFLSAAALVELRGPVVDSLRDFGVSQGLDVALLLGAWERVCERYLSERYDPQTSLFQAHDRQVERAWGVFLYQHLLPELVRNDELVRNVLRALGGLPSRAPKAAAEAVELHLAEMSLPLGPPAPAVGGDMDW